MTTPSGEIRVSHVAGELGISLPLSLKDSRVLALAGQGGVPIALSSLRNKTAAVGTFGATSYSDYKTGSTVSGALTLTGRPSVAASGGTGSYTYLWSFTNNSGAMSLTNATAQSPSVSRTFSRFEQEEATSTLQCIVSDTGGRSVTVSNITVTLEAF